MQRLCDTSAWTRVSHYRENLRLNGGFQMGFKAIVCISRAIVSNCALVWPFGASFQGEFSWQNDDNRRQMWIIVDRYLKPHLLRLQLDVPNTSVAHRSSLRTKTCWSGKKRNPNPNFLVRISSGRVGVFHVKGWGPKSSVCPSKPGKSNVFGGISRDFAGISRRHLKSLRKNVCVQFLAPCWSKSRPDCVIGASCACHRRKPPIV